MVYYYLFGVFLVCSRLLVRGDDRKTRHPFAFWLSWHWSRVWERLLCFYLSKLVFYDFIQFKGNFVCGKNKVSWLSYLRIPQSTYIKVTLNKCIKETCFATFAISHNWQLVSLRSLSCVLQTSFSIWINNQLVATMFSLLDWQIS